MTSQTCVAYTNVCKQTLFNKKHTSEHVQTFYLYKHIRGRSVFQGERVLFRKRQQNVPAVGEQGSYSAGVDPMSLRLLGGQKDDLEETFAKIEEKQAHLHVCESTWFFLTNA